MILSYDYGISLRGIPNPFQWTKLVKSIYYVCVVLFGIMMLLSKECMSSLELSSRGPRYSYYYKTDNSNVSRISSNQCLVLSGNLSKEICSDTGNKQRIHKLRNNDLSLNFCNMYTPLIKLIPPTDRTQIEMGNKAECRQKLNELVERDKQVNSVYCTFMEIIRKIDCDHTKFSVKWNCDECKEAYKKWLCSSELDYYHRVKYDRPVPPCDSFCSAVERKCPFIRPEMDNFVYAGEPSFICKDRSLDMTPRSLSSNSSSKCYEQKCDNSGCHFRLNPPRAITTEKNSNSNSTAKSSCCTNYMPCYSVWTCLTFISYVMVARTCNQYLTIGWT